MITGRQIAAARALLKINADELATLARLGVATVRRAEAADGQPNITLANLTAIRTALETAGVQFLAGGQIAAGNGVALAKDAPE